jgi:hypothetical protein
MLKLVENPARQGQVVNPVFSGAGFLGFMDEQDECTCPLERLLLIIFLHFDLKKEEFPGGIFGLAG